MNKIVSFSDEACAGEASLVSTPASSSVPTDSSSTRQAMPLGAARTLSLNRRAVIFSPRNDTKYFHSDDSILPSASAGQPLDLKLHPTSDPVTPHNSSRRSRTVRGTPSLVKSILKSRAQQIRIAASVEEGTLSNREPARLLISGKRPALAARDSFELVAMVGGEDPRVVKDTVRMSSGAPSSDESAPSSTAGGSDGIEIAEGSEDEEEEAEIEQDGTLATGSLIDIILNGAEDLLTLEEAYNILTLRLRHRMPTDSEGTITPEIEEDIRSAAGPIHDEAPAMVRAIQRDICRLLGKPPTSEPAMERLESSPFREITPLVIDRKDRFTPSPSPPPAGDGVSPSKAERQGYTAAEIRYRREASGVGAAVLRFLAFIFHNPQLYCCFSEADLQLLLDQVLGITRVPRLPTPNPKRTYFLCVILLTQLKLPLSCVSPLKDKIVRAAVKAVMEDFRLRNSGTASDKPGPNGFKKEGLSAVANLLNTYPTLFFPYYAELLPPCLSAYNNSSVQIRFRAGAAVAAFAKAKMIFMAHVQSGPQETWQAVKTVIQKSEFFVVSHLKGAYILPTTSSPVYRKDGGKQTAWAVLESRFKATVGENKEVHVACASWAAIVTLIGSAYMLSGLSFKRIDYIMEGSLKATTNAIRPILARAAWNHAIHAYLSYGSTTCYLEDGRIIKSYKPFMASREQEKSFENAVEMPIWLALKEALAESNFTTGRNGPVGRRPAHYVWKRNEKSKKLQWLTTTAMTTTAVMYAYIGVAFHSQDLPGGDMTALSGLPSSDISDEPITLTLDQKRRSRLDQTWDKIVYPILHSFFSIRGIDALLTYSWDILDALTTSSEKQTLWDFDKLVTTGYHSIDVFDVEKESELPSLLDHFQAVSLTPADIPSFGKSWVAFRLGKWGHLFMEALSSVHGLNHPDSTQWVKDNSGAPLIPVSLSKVWCNLLHALASFSNSVGEEHSVYLLGIMTVTEVLIQVWRRHPKEIIPISQIGDDGKCFFDEERVRIGLTSHLFNLSTEILGEDALGNIKFPKEKNASLASYAACAFGIEEASSTCAGFLLGQVVRTNFVVPNDQEIRSLFMKFVKEVLHVGLQGDSWKRFLGSITIAVPFLFELNEELNMDIWRMIASEWSERIVYDKQPSPNNYTGNILISLLSDPFRGRQLNSYWHQQATLDDLSQWRKLLETTAQRFKAKRAVIHSGLLETLAAHLTDFLEPKDKTLCSPTTLYCLGAATSLISFQPEIHRNQYSPWQADANHVPVDFLTLLNSSLTHAYSAAQFPNAKIHHGLKILLESINVVLGKVPVGYREDVLCPLMEGLRVWMKDDSGVVSQDMAQLLDDLNATILSLQTNSASSSCDLTISPQRIQLILDLYSSRAIRSALVGQNLMTLISCILERSYNYPTPEVIGAVEKLFGFLMLFFNEMSPENAKQLFNTVPLGLVTWLKDTNKLVEQSPLEEKLNDLYRLILTLFAEIIPSHIPADSTTVNALSPIYSSRASYMPLAFLEFWSITFQGIHNLAFDDDTKAFLRDMMEVQEGKFEVPGLSLETQMAHESFSSPQPRHLSQSQLNQTPLQVSGMDMESGQSYDADESQIDSYAKTEVVSVDDGKAQTNSGLVREQGIRQPADGPITGSVVTREDVFGPAPATVKRVKRRVKAKNIEGKGKTKKTAAKGVRQKSGSAKTFKPSVPVQTELESQTGCEVESPLGEASEDECIVVQPEYEYYIRKGLTPPPDHPASVSSPTQGSQTEVETKDVAENAEPKTGSPSSEQHQTSISQRASLLSSAGRWLAKVPSLSFFSPSNTSKSHVPMEMPADNSLSEPASVGKKQAGRKPRKRKASGQHQNPPKRARSNVSVSSLHSEGSQRQIPVVEINSRSRSSSSPQAMKDDVRKVAVEVPSGDKGKNNVPVPTEGPEDEDELLLSPESAKKQRQEEEAHLRLAMGSLGSQSWNESISGRFDDAPTDRSPDQVTPLRPRRASILKVPSGPSPTRRTAQQVHILSMMEEVVRTKEAIDTLDFEGTKMLLKQLKEIHEVAEERMLARMDEMRGK